MKSLIETFVTVFLVSVTILICMMFVGVQMQTNQAREVHTDYVNKIENSNLDTSVINECISDAASKGFDMHIKGIVTDSGGGTAITKKYQCLDCSNTTNMYDASGHEITRCPFCNSTNLKQYNHDYYCLVSLGYKIKVPVLGLERDGIINGYAR